MFGMFEFSWFFYKQQLVLSGVRDAARYLARTTQDGTDPCTQATAVANAKSIATTGVLSGGSPRLTGWSVGDVTIACPSFNNSGGAYLGASTIYRITVSTSFIDPALGYFGLLGLSVPNISASHTERSIGPG